MAAGKCRDRQPDAAAGKRRCGMKWRLRRRRDRELEEEIQVHLAMAARDRIERGETAEMG